MKDRPHAGQNGPDPHGPNRGRRRAGLSDTGEKTGGEKTGGEKTGGEKTGGNAGGVCADGRSIADLAEDWIALWQSELAALATDRESGEHWHILLNTWSRVAQTWFGAMPFGASDNGRAEPPPRAAPGGSPRAAVKKPARARRPEGSPPAAVTPDVRDAEIDRLHRLVAQLELRLADIERRAGQPARHRRNSERLGRKR